MAVKSPKECLAFEKSYPNNCLETTAKITRNMQEIQTLKLVNTGQLILLQKEYAETVKRIKLQVKDQAL